jgi:hypothetical protein
MQFKEIKTEDVIITFWPSSHHTSSTFFLGLDLKKKKKMVKIF